MLDSSKLEEFADNHFNFDEQVENIVEKGEIVCNEQFLLYPQCFKKTYTADTSN